MSNSSLRRKSSRVKSSSEPLSILRVLQCLEVGPVRLEPNRLFMPYVVWAKGKRESVDLIYRYDENVFEPGEPESVNLASLIGAQAALNYGLFCRKILFRGPFDSHDRRFLVDMAENTAREIYVKKFLEPNPFLIGKAAELPAVRLKKYLGSKIVFENQGDNFESSREITPQESDWKPRTGSYAVLSSGGKDSLLSFGLLNELGYGPQAIYVNESGRHWYTALNSYRHFKATYPGTSRVWTNADRVFNWMLRHFPFIRQDFANVRSDEYPIRLWTVAVFIFGAIPIMRKRGLANLIIGDEYDTTRVMRHEGILHYDGLYDQSRYFDNALSRYYGRKGWKIKQFSIIRPLREMLIQKILVERYSELQRQQVSCHATHIVGSRVKPCGRCEKCRRIVGMLLAITADPSRCGYTKEQIRRVLNDLSKTHLRQDAASAEHLAYMLRRKGLISPQSKSAIRAREHPEVLKAVLDPEKSPEEEIPRELRQRLFSIFRLHGMGIIRKSGVKRA